MGRQEFGARAETVISAVKEITMGYGREVCVVLGNALQSLKAAEAGGCFCTHMAPIFRGRGRHLWCPECFVQG